MVNKKKQRNIIIGILIIIGLIIYFNSGTSTLTISGFEPDEETLDFCSVESECINFLQQQGMPSDFLSKNKLEVNCNNGICTVKQK